MDQRCVYGDFSLDAGEGLDFETIRRRWGLSQCVVSYIMLTCNATADTYNRS